MVEQIGSRGVRDKPEVHPNSMTRYRASAITVCFYDRILGREQGGVTIMNLGSRKDALAPLEL